MHNTIKDIQKDDKSFFKKEKAFFNKKLSSLKKNSFGTINALRPLKYRCANTRDLNKELTKNPYIYSLLDLYKVDFNLHDKIKTIITPVLFNINNPETAYKKIRQIFLTKIQEKHLATKRAESVIDNKYFDLMPINLSLELKDGRFNSVRQHYFLFFNSVSVKMFVSKELEKAYSDIYKKVEDEMNSGSIMAYMAMIVMLTGIRPGVRVGQVIKNGKTLDTFGLTLLEKNHCHFEGNKLFFKFYGKKGTFNTYVVENPQIISKIKELYKNTEDVIFKQDDKPIDYNAFLKYIGETGFTPSDFRKRIANLTLFNHLKEHTIEDKYTYAKAGFTKVAEKLNHDDLDINVGINSYVNPIILTKFVTGSLDDNFIDAVTKTDFKVKK